jgi:predicted permease
MIDSVANIIARILPIILIIALGNLIRARSFLSADTVDELRGLVVNFALPPVLFAAFLDMHLETAFVGLFVTMASICVALLGLGYLLHRILHNRHEYLPFLITGFEFGMVGITLFGSAYGLANIGYIAIVDLGHELFIWFVLATLLAARRDGVSSLARTLRGFATSPLIIAILAALTLNLLGVRDWFHETAAGAVVLETFHYLGNLLIPLILILIGYGMGLSWQGIREAAGVVFGRLALLIPLALLVNLLVVRRLLGLGPAFEKAVFTFFILPPPYIIMLFIRREKAEERVYVNNVLSVYTAVALVIFIVYFALNPTL